MRNFDAEFEEALKVLEVKAQEATAKGASMIGIREAEFIFTIIRSVKRWKEDRYDDYREYEQEILKNNTLRSYIEDLKEELEDKTSCLKQLRFALLNDHCPAAECLDRWGQE